MSAHLEIGETCSLPTTMLVDHLTCLCRRGFSWIRLGLETENTTGLAYNFTRCLARLYFGRYFKLPEVVAQAETWYGRILGLLRQDIQGDAHKQHLKLLLAVKTATIFETIRCTTPTGWIAHTRGLAEIIQHLGVALYKSRPLNAACDLCRMFIISEAIRNRHHIFLTDPEWLESARPQDMRYPESTIFDILTYIPGLLTDIERANSPSTRGLPTADVLDFRTLDILQKLFAWRWAWEDYLGSMVYEQATDVSMGITVDDQGQQLWPTTLGFADQMHATHISYYDAGLMMTLKIAESRFGERWQERVNRTPPADLLRPFRPSPLTLPDELQTVS